MVSLWHPKPDLDTIEPLVASLIPQAVKQCGGLCEPGANGFAIALGREEETKYQLAGVTEITPYAANDQASHISPVHPLIQEFAEVVLADAPVDLVRLVLERPRPPGRVLEKLAAFLTLRPAKIELDKVQAVERVWVHSVYWLSLEAMDCGQRLKHVIQDESGRFLAAPEVLLKRLQDQSGMWQVETFNTLPTEVTLSRQIQLTAGEFQSEFKTEIENLQRVEINKALTYYDHLERDLKKRRDREEGKCAQRKAGDDVRQRSLQVYDDKLERLCAERDLRLHNIMERFRAQFTVQPVGARVLLIPTYSCHFKPQQQSSLGLRVPYCPVLREFLPPPCDHCHQPTRDLTLSASGYVCVRCR